MSAQASESCHYYRKDGSPCYEMPRKGKPGADGSLMRPTNVGDARKLGLVPSVSTVQVIKTKSPNFIRWIRHNCFDAAISFPRLEGETVKAHFERLDKEADRVRDEAADWGTALHVAMEQAALWEPYDPSLKREVEGAFDELARGIAEPCIWHPEKSFANLEHGFAGKVDLHTPPGASALWVVDYKGKAFDEEDDRLAWPEHCTQLAAYRLGLGLKGAKCANLFVSRTVPGLARLHVWSERELQKHEALFLALLRTWEIENDYSAREGA